MDAAQIEHTPRSSRAAHREEEANERRAGAARIEPRGSAFRFSTLACAEPDALGPRPGQVADGHSEASLVLALFSLRDMKGQDGKGTKTGQFT